MRGWNFAMWTVLLVACFVGVMSAGEEPGAVEKMRADAAAKAEAAGPVKPQGNGLARAEAIIANAIGVQLKPGELDSVLADFAKVGSMGPDGKPNPEARIKPGASESEKAEFFLGSVRAYIQTNVEAAAIIGSRENSPFVTPR